MKILKNISALCFLLSIVVVFLSVIFAAGAVYIIALFDNTETVTDKELVGLICGSWIGPDYYIDYNISYLLSDDFQSRFDVCIIGSRFQFFRISSSTFKQQMRRLYGQGTKVILLFDFWHEEPPLYGNPHNVYYTREFDEAMKQRIFRAFDVFEQVKDCIYCVSLAEENRLEDKTCLGEVYGFIKTHYRWAKLYQWMSFTVAFSNFTDLAADGYIIDPYGYGEEQSEKWLKTTFEDYVKPFLATGKQVINVAYAAIEYYHGQRLQDIQPYPSMWEQLPFCREHKVWVVFYAAYTPEIIVVPAENIYDMVMENRSSLEVKQKWQEIIDATEYLKG